MTRCEYADIVMDGVDLLMRAGQYEFLDLLVTNTNYLNAERTNDADGTLDDDLLWLTATLPAAKHLPSRAHLFDGAVYRAKLWGEYTPDLFRGLESPENIEDDGNARPSQ